MRNLDTVHCISNASTRFGRILIFGSKQENPYPVSHFLRKDVSPPILVCDQKSSYDLRKGYCIGMDERLIDFYNRRFEALSQLDFELDPNCISVTDFHADTSVKIDFRRTARVPDDGETYKAPRPFQSFPLFSSRHYQQRLPEQMRKKGDIFFPMLQRETFTIGFQAKTDNNQFAIRVLTGSVNVITGNSAKHENSSDEQDYIVVPQQSVLSGFKSGANVMKQFVTMPMGSEYTVEKQVTGEEYIGEFNSKSYLVCDNQWCSQGRLHRKMNPLIPKIGSTCCLLQDNLDFKLVQKYGWQTSNPGNCTIFKIQISLGPKIWLTKS